MWTITFFPFSLSFPTIPGMVQISPYRTNTISISDSRQAFSPSSSFTAAITGQSSNCSSSFLFINDASRFHYIRAGRFFRNKVRRMIPIFRKIACKKEKDKQNRALFPSPIPLSPVSFCILAQWGRFCNHVYRVFQSSFSAMGYFYGMGKK